MRTPRVLTYTEGNTEASDKGEDVEVRRSHQAVACRKRDVREPGRPQRLRPEGSMQVRYTVVEARKGKPGDGIRLEPKRHEEARSRQAEDYCQRESPPYAVGESYQA